MEAVIFAPSFAAVAFLVFLALKHSDKRLTFAFWLLFAAYLGFDDLVTGLPSSSSAFRFIGRDWNWSGKIYSLLLSAVVMLALGIKPTARSYPVTKKPEGIPDAPALLLGLIRGREAIARHPLDRGVHHRHCLLASGTD